MLIVDIALLFLGTYILPKGVTYSIVDTVTFFTKLGRSQSVHKLKYLIIVTVLVQMDIK